MRLDLDPSANKVLIIACLIVLEGVLINAYAIMQQNRFPEPIEWATYITAAFIQLITYILTFLKTGETPIHETPK